MKKVALFTDMGAAITKIKGGRRLGDGREVQDFIAILFRAGRDGNAVGIYSPAGSPSRGKVCRRGSGSVLAT
jgi:hypothetical protein